MQSSPLAQYGKSSRGDRYSPPPRGEREVPTDAVLIQTRKYLNYHEEMFGHELPTIPGLATVLGVPTSVIVSWRSITSDEKGADFNETCDLIEAKLEHVLLHEGVQGMLAQPVTTLALQSLYNYRKNEQVSGPDKGPVRVALDITPEEAQVGYKDLIG